MRYLLIFTFIIFSFFARADQGAMEPPLSETSKAQALQVLAEALTDKMISRQQYDEAIVWVRSSPCDGVNRAV